MATRILVVEDEPGIADAVTYTLRTEGMEATWCTTAREARSLLAGGRFDLMVLDVGLPDANGFDFCRDLRKSSAIPVIFLTARAAEVDRVVGLEIGGDDYVVKPFSPRELAARVKAVLRRIATGEPGAEAVRWGPFALDKKRATVTYFNKPVELSRCEYRLLEVLLQRPGWVFSREQLLQLAWEAPEASMDRTVDTHIKTLRAKLEKIKPGQDPIQTHRGLGYALKEKA